RRRISGWAFPSAMLGASASVRSSVDPVLRPPSTRRSLGCRSRVVHPDALYSDHAFRGTSVALRLLAPPHGLLTWSVGRAQALLSCRMFAPLPLGTISVARDRSPPDALSRPTHAPGHFVAIRGDSGLRYLT